MKKTKIGVIGCGMISDTYFNAAKRFRNIEIVGCSDIIPERSKAKAETYNIKQMTNDEISTAPKSNSLSTSPPRKFTPKSPSVLCKPVNIPTPKNPSA